MTTPTNVVSITTVNLSSSFVIQEALATFNGTNLPLSSGEYIQLQVNNQEWLSAKLLSISTWQIDNVDIDIVGTNVIKTRIINTKQESGPVEEYSLIREATPISYYGLFGKENHYCHHTIRKYTVAFGSLFNDMWIKLENPTSNTHQFKKVTLKQASGNMYENTRQDYESRDTKNIAMILPAMSYELIDFMRDDNRKLNRNNEISSVVIKNATNPSSNIQLNRIPYNFNFDLVIRTKTEYEMHQIVEQILGAFNPDITLSILDNDDLNLMQDIVLRLNENIAKQNNYDDVEGLQYIEWTLSFTLKGYLYRKTTKSGIITKVTISALFGKNAIDDYVLYNDIVTEGIPSISEDVVLPKTTKRKKQQKID